jgi:uncharacterized protein YbaP (TraB family)
MRRLVFLFMALLPAPAWAACTGTDLIAEMPQERRAAMFAEAEAQPFPRGILWRAERGDELIHLVGTMHFYDPRHQATFDQITPWLEGATTIMLELGEGDEARLQDHIAAEPSLAFIIEGPTLPELLSPADWDSLAEAFSDRGVPSFFGAKMRPWMALVTLGLTKCVIEDVNAGKIGLDQMISDMASALGNPAVALEDYDAVLKVFETYTQEEILTFLQLFLQLEAYDPDDNHFTLVEHYFAEEIRVVWEFGIYQSLAEPLGMTEAEIRFEYARLEEALINIRNRAWMDRILPAAAQGPVVVAAGALHLPGEDGLLALLQEEGFTLSRVTRE